VLRKFNFNLQKVIQANKNSPIGYGSKFRNPTVLAPLLNQHPHWNLLQNLLINGSVWSLQELNKEERQKDVDESLQFGNHKRASLNKEKLRTMISNKVSRGYILPLQLSKITRVPGILLAPLKVQHQNTIDEEGNIIKKDRLTHNQSFKFSGSNSSVNSRLNITKLSPGISRWVIERLINWIVTARRK
jgi:hypothetical protein